MIPAGKLAAVKVEKDYDGTKPSPRVTEKPAGEHITLKVQDTSGRAVYRLMRRTEQLQSLMDHYYDTVRSVQRGTGRFLYDGRRLRGSHTPAELEMQDGDEVDFFSEMIGGAGLFPPSVLA
ncbi:hypothetical protein GUJ93_ZPchr0007g3545 [Zizania palustris]|uniref:Ubiquitin-like domain-containing protein n=1 Tax=Zizania palustris TaxID=103762 RepID=A0A8J5T7F0_ZIZPA|nr:hypothetical protein GUJ93_ZPchr0007g3545 [Zizania palustris]